MKKIYFGSVDAGNTTFCLYQTFFVSWAEEKEKCVRHGYIYIYIEVMYIIIRCAQMHTYTHIKRALTESERCPGERRLAIHEITKQTEAYGLASSHLFW